MKRLIFFLFVIFNTNLFSQVTVGAGEATIKGALLQLKNEENVIDDLPNSNKGLALPRVELTGTTIPTMKKGSNLTNFAGNEKAHTGLTVYNVTNNSLDLCPGVYVWNGTQWVRLYGKCSTPSIDCTNTTAPDIPRNTTLNLQIYIQVNINDSSLYPFLDNTVIGTNGTLSIKVDGTQVLSSTNQQLKAKITGATNAAVGSKIAVPLTLDGFNGCDLTLNVIDTPKGYFDCDQFSKDMIIPTCEAVNKKTSVMIFVTDPSTIITINNGQELATGIYEGKTYSVKAEKIASPSDPSTSYTITSATSPQYINLVVTGPAADNPGTLPILFNKITGIQSCSNASIQFISENVTTTPKVIIFTSGRDGFSRGWGYTMNLGVTGVTGKAVINPDKDFTPGSWALVRPWDVVGVNFRGIIDDNNPNWLGGSSTGIYSTNDNNFWPFMVRWKPSTSILNLQRSSNIPAITFLKGSGTSTSEGYNLPNNNPPSGNTCLTGYAGYKAPESPINTPFWNDFIQVQPIDISLGSLFTLNKPYTIEQDILAKTSTGDQAKFIVRQIHYGIELLAANPTNPLIADGYGGYKARWNGVTNSWSFQFIIRSNAKWLITAVMCIDLATGLPVTTTISHPKGTWGPEEDPSGLIRDTYVTVNFPQISSFTSTSSIAFTFALTSPKVIGLDTNGNRMAGMQTMTIKFRPDY